MELSPRAPALMDGGGGGGVWEGEGKGLSSFTKINAKLLFTIMNISFTTFSGVIMQTNFFKPA